VIVADLDVIRVTVDTPEADAPLSVHGNRVLHHVLAELPAGPSFELSR